MRKLIESTFISLDGDVSRELMQCSGQDRSRGRCSSIG